MRVPIRRMLAFGFAAGMTVAPLGCGGGDESSSERVEEAADEAGDRVEEAADDVGDAVEEAAEEAGDAVEDAAEDPQN